MRKEMPCVCEESFLNETLKYKTTATWFILKRNNCKCKSRYSRNSEEDSVYTQILVSIPMCVKLSIRENVWEFMTGRVNLCELCLSISVTKWMCCKDIWNKWQCFSSYYVFS